MFSRIIGRCWSVIWSTWNGWREHNGTLLSAATAYYAAFSLFPLCLVLIAGAGFFGRYSSFAQLQQQDLIERVSHNVGPWLAGELQGILAGVQNRAALGGPLGLFVLLLTAVGLFMQLETIFARVWDEHEPANPIGFLATLRAVLWSRLLSFLTLLLIGALLVVVFLSDIVLAGIRPYLDKLPAAQSTWHLVQLSSTIGCDTLLLATLYGVLPKAHVRWWAALAGGFLAAVVWAIGRSVLLSFLIGDKYSAYGVVGAVMGMMLWFYYASAVIFLGAEFVHALGLPHHSPDLDNQSE